jgi:hypothetical protein
MHGAGALSRPVPSEPETMANPSPRATAAPAGRAAVSLALGAAAACLAFLPLALATVPAAERRPSYGLAGLAAMALSSACLIGAAANLEN